MSLGRLLAAGKSLIGVKEKAGRYQMRPAALLPKFISDKNPFGTTPVPEVKPEPKKSDPKKPEPSTPGRRRTQGSTASQTPAPEPVKPPMSQPETARQMTPSLFDPIAPAHDTPRPTAVELKYGIAPLDAPELLGDIGAAIPNMSSPKTFDAPDSPRTEEAATPRSEVPAQKILEPKTTRPLAAPAKPRVTFGARLRKLNPLAFLSSLKPAPKLVMARRARAAEQAELSLERVIPVRNDLSDSDLEVITARPAGAAKLPAPVAQSARAMTLAEPAAPLPAAEPTTWGRLSSRWFGAGQATHTQAH